MTSKFRALFDVQDMTTGSSMRNIVQFSVPLLIGNLAQQLYSTVDSIVVGRYVGDTALAAVGASGPVINLLIVLFVGISTGAGIMVSQYFGAKQKEHLSTTVGNCVTLTLISALIIMALGALITRPLMSLLHTPAEIYDMACDYMTIIFVGILGSAYYNIFSGILRGLGDSVTPLIFLLIACALNTVLDIWFVAGLRMGVAGAAWATILAQFVSGGLCLIRLLMMRKVVQINRKTLHLHKFYAVQLAKLGLPSGITQAIFSLAMIVVQSLTNSMGTAVIACTTVVMRVDGFAMMPNFTFGTAATTYVGQNIGARRADRIHQGTKDLMLLALSVAAVLVLCILLFGHNLIGLFTTTEDVLAIGQRGLHWLAVGYLCFAVSQVLQGEMRGAGETMIPMWISIISTVILRMPLAYLLAYLTRSDVWPNGNPDMLYASLLLSWISSMLMTIVAYRAGWWRRKLPDDLKETL